MGIWDGNMPKSIRGKDGSTLLDVSRAGQPQDEALFDQKFSQIKAQAERDAAYEKQKQAAQAEAAGATAAALSPGPTALKYVKPRDQIEQDLGILEIEKTLRNVSYKLEAAAKMGEFDDTTMRQVGDLLQVASKTITNEERMSKYEKTHQENEILLEENQRLTDTCKNLRDALLESKAQMSMELDLNSKYVSQQKKQMKSAEALKEDLLKEQAEKNEVYFENKKLKMAFEVLEKKVVEALDLHVEEKKVVDTLKEENRRILAQLAAKTDQYQTVQSDLISTYESSSTMKMERDNISRKCDQANDLLNDFKAKTSKLEVQCRLLSDKDQDNSNMMRSLVQEYDEQKRELAAKVDDLTRALLEQEARFQEEKRLHEESRLENEQLQEKMSTQERDYSRQKHMVLKDKMLDDDMTTLRSDVRRLSKEVDSLKAEKQEEKDAKEYYMRITKSLRNEVKQQHIDMESMRHGIKELMVKDPADESAHFQGLRNELAKVKSGMAALMGDETGGDTSQYEGNLRQILDHIKYLENRYEAQKLATHSLWGRVRELVSCCKESLEEATRFKSLCLRMSQEHGLKVGDLSSTMNESGIRKSINNSIEALSQMRKGKQDDKMGSSNMMSSKDAMYQN